MSLGSTLARLISEARAKDVDSGPREPYHPSSDCQARSDLTQRLDAADRVWAADLSAARATYEDSKARAWRRYHEDLARLAHLAGEGSR